MKTAEIAKLLLLEHSCYNCWNYFPHNNKCEIMTNLGGGWQDIPKSLMCENYIYNDKNTF